LKKKFLTTDYALSLRHRPEILAEFLHMVFVEFSNFDNEFTLTISFNELKSMFRLSNILSLDANEDDDDEGIIPEEML